MKDSTNVVRLFQPHQSRIKRIRDWYSAQASEDHVAMVSVAITSDNTVKTTGLAIEPAHARVLLRSIMDLQIKLMRLDRRRTLKKT